MDEPKVALVLGGGGIKPYALIPPGKIYTKTIAAAQRCLSINLLEGEVANIKVLFHKYISIWEAEKMPAILDAGEIALEREKGEIRLAYDHYKQVNRAICSPDFENLHFGIL